MRRTSAWGGLALAGMLSLAACGGSGTTVVEAGSESGGGDRVSGPGSAGDGDGDGDGQEIGCSSPGHDPSAGTPAPTADATVCDGGVEPAPGDLDGAVTSPPIDRAEPPPVGPTHELVTPRAGMVNVRPLTWDHAQVRSDRSVRVAFWGGVEPCHVLDSVKVAYAAKTVTITLYSGSDPAQPDVACIEIAKAMAVDVKLTESLDGRTVVDGSPGATSEGGSDAAHPADPGTSEKRPAFDPAGADARVVTPRPGTADAVPQSWERATATGPMAVRVYFTSGVEPCSVLDSYRVRYEPDRIVITLASGRDPQVGPDTACIKIAEHKAVDVTLTEAHGGREFVDGSTPETVK